MSKYAIDRNAFWVTGVFPGAIPENDSELFTAI
jgi:hypothetical protein